MMGEDTSGRVLGEIRRRLLAGDHSAMSTHRAADEAGVPLSQTHRHFRPKDELAN